MRPSYDEEKTLHITTKKIESMRMRCTESLHNLHLKLENSINKLVRRCAPTLQDTTLQKMWLVFYILFGICWLGGALLSCLGTAILTAGGYLVLQDYYPTVAANELTNISLIGERVRFEVNELNSNETITSPDQNYRIPAISYVYHHAQELTSGNIRLDLSLMRNGILGIYANDDREAAEWEKQLQTTLQSQGLSREVQESQTKRYIHSYIPPHITGRFQAEGQLIRPDEVQVHQLSSVNYQNDTTFSDQVIIIISLTAITSSLILIGIWGWIWSLRSFLRIRKNGAYRAPSKLITTALLQGGSLIVLSYLAGYTALMLIIELSLLKCITPYYCQPLLQWVAGGSIIFILQLSSYRLRQFSA